MAKPSASLSTTSVWWQKTVTLPPKRRGCHLVTDEILAHLPELAAIRVGLAHFFLQHTSASLTLNENADPDVRTDMQTHLERLVPDSEDTYSHTTEGADDMPAHLKASLLGVENSVPITDGRLNLGTWQGLYLCEYRNNGGPRRLVVTVHGDAFVPKEGLK